jgi:amino acid permease
MSTEWLIIGISNICVAIFCIVTSIPLLNGRIKRNRWYGIRIRKAFVSEENWKKVNEYGARAIIRWSVLVLIMGLLLVIASFFISFKPTQNIVWLLIPTLLSVVFILGALVQTWIWSRHLPDK